MLIANELLSNPGILQDLPILVVDNDQDNRDLYVFLLESHGAKVTTIGSVKAALDLLDGYMPALLICEVRFWSESVHPLIQRIQSATFSSGRMIPVLVTSTCSLTSLTQQWKVQAESYLIKPIDLNHFVNEVWQLTLPASVAYPLSVQDWVTGQDNTAWCVDEIKTPFERGNNLFSVN
jgi:CheY-like chemotaxis protein